VVLSGSELPPEVAAGIPDPVGAEAAAVVVGAGAVAEVEAEAVEVVPTSGTATTPSITIITGPDRETEEVRTRGETGVMIVEMMAGNPTGTREGGDLLTDPADLTEKTPRQLPRYIYMCVTTS